MKRIAIVLAAVSMSCSRAPETPAPPAAAPVASAPAPPAASSLPLVAGVVVLTGEDPRITVCGEASPHHLTDATGGELASAYGELASETTGELWAELRAETAGDKLVARAFVRGRRVTGGDACAEAALPAGELRANGTAPPWSARITAAGIEWTEADAAAAVVFPAVEPVVSGARRTWTSSLEGSSARTLVIAVAPALCKDPAAAAWEALAAEAVLDQRAFQGCAAEGR